MPTPEEKKAIVSEYKRHLEDVKDGMPFDEVPAEFKDLELCVEAVREHAECIKEVPSEIMCEVLYSLFDRIDKEEFRLCLLHLCNPKRKK